MKTYLEDFLEKHPNAILDREGLPTVCPYQLGYGKPICEEVEALNLNMYFCKKCWNGFIIEEE